jgi:hypothetical protein
LASGENQRKNLAIADAESHQETIWAFDDDRNLVITFDSIDAKVKRKLRTQLTTKYGAGKIVVV